MIRWQHGTGVALVAPLKATPPPQLFGLALRGFLPLFAPLSSALERQHGPGDPPPPRVSPPIPPLSPAPREIPLSPPSLRPASIGCRPGVEPQVFTFDLTG